MMSLAVLLLSGGLASPGDQLPPLPRAIRGQCAGVSNGALPVAGGSYFQGGKKTWVGLVTTSIVEWFGIGVIPGGEDRPGHRSDMVAGFKLEKLR